MLGFTFRAMPSRTATSEQAVRLWRRIVAQDPLSPASRGNLRIFSLRQRAAGGSTRRIPNGARTQSGRRGRHIDVDIARILVLLGRYDEALAGHRRLAARERPRLRHRAPAPRPGPAAPKRMQRFAGLPAQAEDASTSWPICAEVARCVLRGMNDRGARPAARIPRELERRSRAASARPMDFQDELPHVAVAQAAARRPALGRPDRTSPRP